jgi:hypothetical protein
MCRFIFFSAPGHFAIVGVPMGEKDISACLRERMTNRSPNSSLAARTCNKSKTTINVLRFHIFLFPHICRDQVLDVRTQIAQMHRQESFVSTYYEQAMETFPIK